MSENHFYTETSNFADAVFFLENHRDVKAAVGLEEALACEAEGEKKIPVELKCPDCNDNFASVVSNFDGRTGVKLANGTLQASLGCLSKSCVYSLNTVNLVSYEANHIKDIVMKQRESWLKGVGYTPKKKPAKKRSTAKKKKEVAESEGTL